MGILNENTYVFTMNAINEESKTKFRWIYCLCLKCVEPIVTVFYLFYIFIRKEKQLFLEKKLIAL